MGLEILIPIFGIMIILVPVIGLTTVFTLRLGGKPFVETLARELRGSGGGSSTELHFKVQDLAEQVEALSAEVHLLRSGQDFDKKLLERHESPTPNASVGVR